VNDNVARVSLSARTFARTPLTSADIDRVIEGGGGGASLGTPSLP